VTVRARAFAAAGVLLLAQGLLGMNCVDGVTPDCFDAAAQCGPSEAGIDVGPAPEAGDAADAADAPDGDAADEDASDASDEV
jgi:hypothetical protein